MARSNHLRRRQFNQVVVITISWMIIGVCKTLYDYQALAAAGCLPENATLLRWLGSIEVALLVVGVFIGTMTVLFFQKWLRAYAYPRALILVIIPYTAVFVLGVIAAFGVRLALGFPDYAQLGGDLFSQVGYFFSSGDFLPGYLFWLVVVLGTCIVLFVNDKYGPGVFRGVLTGKYFRPIVENRVFLAIDLKGSTTIAESLTEEQYFNLLRELIIDMTHPILASGGQVYQYVGDEVIISWQFEAGIKQARSLHCFYDIRREMEDSGDKYEERYGVRPKFKGALHCGQVLAGEIGVIKRDITYTGDVLNTTSRIESMCNKLNVDFLMSEDMYEALKPHLNGISASRIGEIALRGKSRDMILYTA